MHVQRRVARIVLIGLLTLGLSACGSGSGISVDGQRIDVHAERVSIRDRSGSTAEIKGNGDLRIAGKTVPLTPAQRMLSTRYFTQAQVIVFDGKQTGWAGAHMAGSVVGSLFSALFHDDSRIIEDTAHAQAARLDGQVDRLCGAIGALRVTQDQLAVRLPAFAPYAAIDPRSVRSCFVNAHASNS
ncbi:MAG: hypothetical protein M0P72_03700 [Metallibacterium scheffleri]|uniref:hypothetical protein n=1 Tax=Metallibacterium scheffleri TaxID=993689 RepID=UPI0026EB88A9|nr:hypothetical protein [Metallibacterium scheffleri]MCK9366240.1 hypothetical protein [Metallibacterium scheffleri]